LQFKQICILGLGYIGLPTAGTFASRGVKVLGVDVNPRVIATLRAGELHIQEPGLHETVRSALSSGNFSVGSTPEEADAFVIAVPTPFQKDRHGEADGHPYKLADLGAVTAAAEAIVPVLRRGNLVVLESTSPPRTTADVIAPILARSGLQPGRDFHLAYSPERVLPGQILRELVENARVVGGLTPACAAAAAELYGIFVTGEIVQTDSTTAEMVKLMENTSRDVGIAIANEFARLADRFGVDVWEAIALANRHPRVKILSPGPGVGGHCISVDPWFLVEAAPDLTPLISTARRVNDAQPEFVVELVRHSLGALHGRKIAALGLAYKPEVDDLRESPAVEVVRLLQKQGAQVRAFEPFRPEADGLEIAAAPGLEAAVESADAILLLVRHTQFVRIDPAQLAELTPARVAVDTVNGWDPAAWEAAGFRLFRLGARR
jgi:UDP-N-acetyl-D-mannosaminuronic acid dehydrogenase